MQVNIDVHAYRVHHNYKIDTSRFEEGKRPLRRCDRMKASLAKPGAHRRDERLGMSVAGAKRTFTAMLLSAKRRKPA
jgi:hypothetical protein